MADKCKCPKCGSENTIKRGIQIECRDGKDHKYTKVKNYQSASPSFQSDGNNAILSTVTDEQVRTLEDAIRVCKIDLSTWEVEKYMVGSHQGYRKDRVVKWDVQDGVVLHGHVDDSGKLLIKPLFTVKVWLRRKVEEIRTTKIISQMMEDLRQASPKVKLLKNWTNKDGLMMEFCFPDIHFGKLAWHEETGTDYDIKIADRMVMMALSKLISYSQSHKIKKIVFPLGNDFFHSDTPQGTTFKGTLLDEDTRWSKTFRMGRQLLVKMIDQLYQVAPVEVIAVPGNHDKTRTFYVADSIEAYYHNNKNIQVNNSARSNKYLLFGSTLIGFNHGETKMDRLSNIMPYEVPDLWAKSRWREWHLGHLHTTKRYDMRVNEEIGITFRTIRSLSGTDSWHYDNGFVGAKRAAEAYLYHPTEGNVANFIATGE